MSENHLQGHMNLSIFVAYYLQLKKVESEKTA